MGRSEARLSAESEVSEACLGQNGLNYVFIISTPMSSSSDDGAFGGVIEQFYGQFMAAPTEQRHYQLDTKVCECDYGDCERMCTYLDEHGDQPLARAMNEAISVIQHILEKCDKIAISFNGGKDATVVLHLVRLVSLIEARKRGEKPHAFFREHFVSFVIHNDPQFREVA